MRLFRVSGVIWVALGLGVFGPDVPAAWAKPAKSLRIPAEVACPSVEVIGRQWAEAIAAGALQGTPGANPCLAPERYPDIRLPEVPPSEPSESSGLPVSTVDSGEGFRVEGVREGELGTRVVRLSWKDAESGKRMEDELTVLLNRGASVRALGCAGLYDGFRKYRPRLQGCR